ncbi:hypothetical protein EG835_01235 [bacterium]|nr:hypothetical protein [bacterium]
MHRALATACLVLAIGLASACGGIPHDIEAACGRVAAAQDTTSFLSILAAALPADDFVGVSIPAAAVAVSRSKGAWEAPQFVPDVSSPPVRRTASLADVARVVSARTSGLSEFEAHVTIFRRSRLGAFLFTVRFSNGRVTEVTPVRFST